jgi:hypothetical protein
VTTWFRTVILATSFAASVAISFAGASVSDAGARPSAKADRLPVFVDRGIVHLTVETRGDGVSVFNRFPVGHDE